MTLGEQMRPTTRKTVSAKFKLEAAQLVLDKNYTIIQAAKAMNVGINADFTILYSEVKTAYRISHGSAGVRTIAQLVTNKGINLSRY